MLNRASKILLALIVAAATGAAQQTGSAPSAAAAPNGPTSPAGGAETTDASGAVLAERPKDYIPAPPVDSDGETRTVSAKVAAALSAGMPKFSPPTPTPTPEAEPQDLRDIDKPKNEIHRLPKYVVRESRPPIFRDRDLFTLDGMLDLTMKRHAGLQFGNILDLNSSPKPGSPAYQMMVDDERGENGDDLADTAHAMAQGGDFAEGSYILQQSQSTYMRGGGTWDWSGTGPVGGILGGGGK
jgi:hypothetical protein